MKFTIPTQELHYLLNKIQNIVPQKPTIPILSNFLIEAANDELILTTTDLNVSLRCNTEVNIIEEGSTTLPAKKFAQLVRELTVPNVEITSDSNETTQLIAGSSKFKILGMNKESFPGLPDLSEAQSFTLQQKDLKYLLYCTSFAVSREDNRYVLTGVLMQVSDGQVLFVGTDGKRLARAHHPITHLSSSFTNQSIIPLKAVEEILKNLREEGEVKISLMPDKIAIHTEQTLIIAKLLIGDYPDIHRIIPESAEIGLSLHREELLSLLRQVSLFIADPHHSVRFTFAEGELKITANTSDIGEGIVGMPVNYHGNKLEIAFNPGHFIGILLHCKEDTVILSLVDAYNPGIITDGELKTKLKEASPLFITMPMRLSED